MLWWWVPQAASPVLLTCLCQAWPCKGEKVGCVRELTVYSVTCPVQSSILRGRVPPSLSLCARCAPSRGTVWLQQWLKLQLPRDPAQRNSGAHLPTPTHSSLPGVCCSWAAKCHAHLPLYIPSPSQGHHTVTINLTGSDCCSCEANETGLCAPHKVHIRS